MSISSELSTSMVTSAVSTGKRLTCSFVIFGLLSNIERPDQGIICPGGRPQGPPHIYHILPRPYFLPSFPMTPPPPSPTSSTFTTPPPPLNPTPPIHPSPI